MGPLMEGAGPGQCSHKRGERLAISDEPSCRPVAVFKKMSNWRKNIRAEF